MEPLELAIMNIIINAGDCKNHAYMALGKVNEGKYDEADEEIKLANEALSKAHDSQTEMLQKEAAGEKVDFSILFVHAQDHLMTTMTFKDMAVELIEVHEKLYKLEDKK